MQQLVLEGLERTRKQASIKQGIDDSLQALQAVREVVDKAVQSAPEAAVAWVGVCLGLEVCDRSAFPFKERLVDDPPLTVDRSFRTLSQRHERTVKASSTSCREWSGIGTW